MKKTVLSLALCGAVLAVSGQKVAAAYPLNTEGDITFIEGSGDNNTPDPNPDPTDPDPDPNPDPDPDPDGGSLKFTYLPNISFGEAELNARSSSYYYALYMNRDYGDTNAEGEYPTFYTVQDVRGGAKGWKVNVSHNSKFKNEDGEEITGYIEVSNSNLKTNTFTASADITQYKPTTTIATGVGQNYTRISGDGTQSVELLRANVGQGYGKWSQGFGETNTKTTGYGPDGTDATGSSVNASKQNRNLGVRLQYPAQIVKTEGKNTYTGDILWTLSDSL